MLVDPTRIHVRRVFAVRGFPDQRGVLRQAWNRTDVAQRVREGPWGAEPGAVAR